MGIGKKNPKNILMQEKFGSVYLGGNVMPHLQDVIHIYIQYPFFCWNAEARGNFSQIKTENNVGSEGTAAGKRQRGSL